MNVSLPCQWDSKKLSTSFKVKLILICESHRKKKYYRVNFVISHNIFCWHSNEANFCLWVSHFIAILKGTFECVNEFFKCLNNWVFVAGEKEKNEFSVFHTRSSWCRAVSGNNRKKLKHNNFGGRVERGINDSCGPLTRGWLTSIFFRAGNYSLASFRANLINFDESKFISRTLHSRCFIFIISRELQARENFVIAK